mmetsp:Transcript_3731/g.9010  ORF Transcript_3731/g.9010 Transcript_3731/m.9010 type:complete len:87 (-) Transcript_3731:110-370(-)
MPQAPVHPSGVVLAKILEQARAVLIPLMLEKTTLRKCGIVDAAAAAVAVAETAVDPAADHAVAVAAAAAVDAAAAAAAAATVMLML